ncbi:MAG TPA: PDZ domain-containing protein [Streptosporangiaceae bacterium]|nr:PDZ domain-containing protein [Streptosporangiaceae bacterium]
MTSSGYLSFPHVHGDLLTFVAEDDVWLAPAGGGRGWRLSADAARATRPRFSPDGDRVAWTGTTDGTPEVYLAPAGGGPGRQLTWWGDDQTETCGWTPAGEVLAISAAGQPFTHFTRAYAVGAGDEPAIRELPYGQVADLAVQASGAALLTGCWGRDPAYWKRYRGGTSGRLWTGGADGGFRRVLAGVRGQFASPMLVGGRLAFLSDHEGTGNVYSCALDGSDLRRHTDHDGGYARQASTDGERIVYCSGGRVWLLPSLDAAGPEPVEISLGSVPPGRAPRLISADDHVGSLSVDASGRASAVEVRGTVHWLAHRDGPALALSVTPGGRARLPQVLGTGGDVVWVTDGDGADALEIGTSRPAGVPDAPRRLAGGQIGRVSSLAAAPDGSKVAVAALDGRLLIVDAAAATVTQLAASDNSEVSGLAWSPDSAWLAWSHPESVPLRRLRIARVADGQVYDVTDGRFTDTEPVFTTDGKYLAFLSKRSFDPVYDAHFFDLSFPFGARPHLVPLAAGTISPFGPQPGGRAIGEDSGDDAAGAGSGSGSGPGDGAEGDKDAADAAKRPAVTVDTDGMPGRVVALPVSESRYFCLRAVKGGLAWLAEPLTGALGEGGARPGDASPRPRLQRFDFRRQSVTGLEDDVDWIEVSGDATRLVVRDRDTLAVIPADRKADPDSPDDRVTIDGSRARFLADPAVLWQHALAEAGRIIQHDFWVPDLSGVDWDSVYEQYRPLVDQVATRSDFADVLWESLGELGTSHAYVTPAPAPDHDGHAAGLLGADLERDADGSWVVRRVVPGESSDPRARSPLLAPGAGVGAGDRLLAVDGRPVGAPGPGPLLAGAGGKPVELTVAAAGAAPRRVVVVPLHSERRLRYQDWVAGRRALARELSGGRAGYLHVPDMMGEGWADFSRDLRAEMTFEMLIVDARGNRGGHTSQLVVEKLARRVVAWEMPRNMRPVSYPVDAPRGPVVALADEFAGSDGDIVTRAIRTLGLGPVVGARTWGGVIGIDGWHELADGSQITVPRYAFWMEGAGWGVENHGVDPDVEVLITPDDWAAGRDPQLETAVRLATEALAARPPAAPPDMNGELPSKRRPALPPRTA